jgi:flagellar FliL protein
MADEPEIEDGESEGGGKSKVLLIVGLLAILALIGGAVFFFMSSGDDDPAEIAGADPLEPSEESSSSLSTEVYELGEFQVNLSGTMGGRILMLEIAVEGSADSVSSIETRQHQIRDAILMLASDYSVSELEGLDGKLRLRDDIHRRINAILAPHRINRVYYTEFKFT